MSRPAVCVVVPVYRAEATLDRCVQSILAQDVDGGLACILVDDGSPDESGALCDAWAARDTRVRVIHQEDRGVSGARNSGLAAAFVLWQYTTDAADPAAVTDAAAPYGQQALARLWLDCVLAMPWNKLYRTALAQRIKFDETYTLGEDLQFVLDYIALLGQTQPGFTYRLLQSPLTFYDCSHTGSLSTRYHANYCEIWPEHFAKLNAACLAAACPERDLRDLHRAELTVYAEGVADILRRDPTPLQGIRRDKAAAALRRPWLRALLDRMRQERCYSAYYLPCRWRSTRLVYAMAEAKRAGSPLYGKLDWAGYYLLGGRLRRD